MTIDQLLQLEPAEQERRGVRHTPAEIAQQPGVWQKTVECVADLAGELGPLLAGSEEIILTGAGSSYFVGVAVEAALTARLGLPVRAIPSTEIVMDPETCLPRRPFTLVSFARSGNSPEGNAAFRLAEGLRKEALRHIVITCNEQGELAQLARGSRRPAGIVLLPEEANDRGLAMTSSFTGMVVAALGLGFLGDTGAWREVGAALAEAGAALLARADALMASLAQRPIERTFFVGARPFYGAALESHLKVQEMTDGAVLGKAEETLGLRHGPMAGIDPATLVVLFFSSSPYRRRYETDLARELAAKGLGAARVVVCAQADPVWRESAHHVLEFDPSGGLALSDDLIAPLLVIPAQLFGLHKGLHLGLAPDSPSKNRVINRVVQGVTIYPYPAAEERA